VEVSPKIAERIARKQICAHRPPRSSRYRGNQWDRLKRELELKASEHGRG
jgi:hypothetical protein